MAISESLVITEFVAWPNLGGPKIISMPILTATRHRKLWLSNLSQNNDQKRWSKIALAGDKNKSRLGLLPAKINILKTHFMH